MGEQTIHRPTARIVDRHGCLELEAAGGVVVRAAIYGARADRGRQHARDQLMREAHARGFVVIAGRWDCPAWQDQVPHRIGRPGTDR